jgi:protease-4
MDRLVGSPGASATAEAGLINPAAWSIQDRGGLYLAWEDLQEVEGIEDFRGVLSLRNLAFGMKRFSIDDASGKQDHYDYTLGLGFGNRSSATGISYSWTRGGHSFMPPSERIVLGQILRWRPVSVGFARSWDLESKDGFYQADIGLRPYRLGNARITLFADAALKQGDNVEDAVFGFGLEGQPIPGLALALRARDTGEISFRVNLGLAGLNPSYRHHLNDDGDHVSTTYAVEFKRAPHLGQAVAFGKKYPEVHLKGPMTYRRYRLFDDRRRFLETLQEIKNYADDPAVAGVVLNLSGFKATWALRWELRAQLAGLRERGKTVVVYFDRLNLSGYSLASVADEIWMDPYGDLDIRGINFGRTYYSRLLEKLGLGFDEWRYYTYKSAFEAFSRTSMSEADREQIGKIVEDFYEEQARLITSSRGLNRAEWERIVDEQGVLLPHEAQEAGLVDKVGDFHEARDEAKNASRRASGDDAVAHLAGVTGDPVWGPEEWGEPPRIVVLYAIGPCAMDEGIRGRRLSKEIRKARENRHVKAVVFRADSPGGDALPSDLVARELKETAKVKPVIVSQGQVAGSGGYWISMHGDSIVASPLTVTGSIGVIAGHIWDDGIGEKIGADYDNIKHGNSSDMFDGPIVPFIGVEIPKRPVTDEERKRAEDLMHDLYHTFTVQVGEGRGMTPEEVDEIGQGRVWSGADGLRIGLVDELGGLWRSLEMAKDATGLPVWRRVEIKEGPDLGFVNLGFLKPRLFGLNALGFGEAAEEKPEHVFRGPLWDDLPPMERDYIEILFKSGRKPTLLMPPLGIEPLLEELE